MIRIILSTQAGYYLVTGIWPLVSLRTFERVTGPKTDDWLVQMVGLLAASIGLVLGMAAWRGRISGEVITLAAAGALSFAVIDLVFSLNGTISRIYLADAAIQMLLLVALLMSLLQSHGKSPKKGPR